MPVFFIEPMNATHHGGMCAMLIGILTMVTIILCFYSSVLEIESPYIGYVKNKK